LANIGCQDCWGEVQGKEKKKGRKKEREKEGKKGRKKEMEERKKE